MCNWPEILSGQLPILYASMTKYFFLKVLVWGLLLGGSQSVFSQSSNRYFISPTGNDAASGLEAGKALASIDKGLELAKAGDTLFLLPGTYSGRNLIESKAGLPDLPIVISSYSNKPEEFAIIDAQSPATQENGNEGFVIENSLWINLEKLVFRNCWASVILIRNSNYIKVASCHFSTGRRIVHPIGHGSHHILVENCQVELPEEVWRGWSWESLHHGELGHYNGALLHPNKSAGGHIMRGNTMINMFNGFRTRPVSILEDGNTEVYRNKLINVRDNEYEPETWAWNMHYYYNEHLNVHKMYSIDGVKGGNIYLYGNTYTQTKDLWAIEEVSGIFKYSAYEEGALTHPCYAFNNSYYTEAEVLRRGESTNHMLKHFNNAYHFFEGEKRFHLKAWQKGYEFDYDCINQDWPPNIYEHDQEKHGLKNTDPMFRNGIEGDFRLMEASACIDAGIAMVLPEFNWTQSFEGKAPDIGAFEGNSLSDGPPFRFMPAAGFDLYEERPRISKHKVLKDKLILYFSAPLNPQSLTAQSIQLFQAGKAVKILSINFPRDKYEVHIQTSVPLEESQCSITWEEGIVGENGLPATRWGSTIPFGQKVPNLPQLAAVQIERIPDMIVPDYSKSRIKISLPSYPDSARVEVKTKYTMKPDFVDRLVIYSEDGDDLAAFYPSEIQGKRAYFNMGQLDLPRGTYKVRLRLGREVLVKKFSIK